MQKTSAKFTIFETMAGPNEKRFQTFNDMPHCSSKYEREQVGIVDFTTIEGREKFTSLYPEPPEMSPDYEANALYFMANLRKGAVKFGSMSARKPNLNKTYGTDNAFFTQQSNTARVELRPKIDRLKSNPLTRTKKKGTVSSSLKPSAPIQPDSTEALTAVWSPKSDMIRSETAGKPPKFNSMSEHL